MLVFGVADGHRQTADPARSMRRLGEDLGNKDTRDAQQKYQYEPGGEPQKEMFHISLTFQEMYPVVYVLWPIAPGILTTTCQQPVFK